MRRRTIGVKTTRPPRVVTSVVYRADSAVKTIGQRGALYRFISAIRIALG